MTDLLDGLDQDTRRTLEQFGFDEPEFVRLRSRVCDGSVSAESNVARGRVEPPAPGDIVRLPEPGEEGYGDAHAAGLEVLRAGQAASIVLNGGMATRFGGTVKGIVEAVDGKSFLELKLGQAARLAEELGVEIPTALMNSFATDRRT